MKKMKVTGRFLMLLLIIMRFNVLSQVTANEVSVSFCKGFITIGQKLTIDSIRCTEEIVISNNGSSDCYFDTLCINVIYHGSVDSNFKKNNYSYTIDHGDFCDPNTNPDMAILNRNLVKVKPGDCIKLKYFHDLSAINKYKYCRFNTRIMYLSSNKKFRTNSKGLYIVPQKYFEKNAKIIDVYYKIPTKDFN